MSLHYFLLITLRTASFSELRVCKNPKIPETRPDPNFSGILRCDLRNLKILLSETRPGPNPNLRVRVFSRVSGYQDGHSNIPQKVWKISREGVKKFYTVVCL